jgi:hypothetical protein
MPLVANTDLPSFDRLRREGETILHREEAVRQDIRELHIGLLNMMPGKALEAWATSPGAAEQALGCLFTPGKRPISSACGWC